MFSENDTKAFENPSKIGILATINPEGLPHLTLITSLQTAGSGQIVWGQFTQGLSKDHIHQNSKTGFLIMTLNLNLWQGQALWTHTQNQGPEYEMYNTQPMFRYNAYFGIHTVHYMDLVKFKGPQIPQYSRILRSVLQTRLAGGAARNPNKDIVLKSWSQHLFTRPDTLKFLGYVGSDGFPVIIPVLQCLAVDYVRLVFSPTAYHDELKNIPVGAPVAVFGMCMNMTSVLVRGTFRGFNRFRFIRLGTIDLEWVYNSMPPIPGQIYPQTKPGLIVDF